MKSSRNPSGNDGYIPIWTKDKKDDYKLTETNLKKDVMVWGAISRERGLRLVCMDGKIDAEAYIDMLECDFWHEVQDSLSCGCIIMLLPMSPTRCTSTLNRRESSRWSGLPCCRTSTRMCHQGYWRKRRANFMLNKPFSWLETCLSPFFCPSCPIWFYIKNWKSELNLAPFWW